MSIKYIGERISYQQEEDRLSIVVLGKEEGSRPTQRMLWLFAWLIIGFYITSEVKTLEAQDDLRPFLFTFLGFWAYYLFRVLRALYWQWKGRESILLKADGIFIKEAFGSLGKTYCHPLANVNLMEPRTKNEGFFSIFEESFWSIGMGELQFVVDGRTYLFGKRISESEGKAIMKVFNEALKKIR